jgi:hypothetical protein
MYVQGVEQTFIFKGTQADYEQINWNFGDSYATSDNPNLASSLQASHVYTHSGEYLVSLIISSGQGLRNKYRQNNPRLQ